MTIWNLQKAVYETLSNDVNITNIVTGVYDFVPDNTLYPYITLKLDEISNWDIISQNGFEVVLTIDVFCKDNANKSCLQIFDLVHNALHDASIALDGSYELQNIQFVTARMLKKNVNDIYKITSNFVAKISY